MTPLFPSLFEEVLFWVTFLAAFIANALPFARVKMETPEDRDRSRSDSLVIGPLFLVMLVVPTALGYARIGVLPDWLFYPGLAVVLIGAGFTIWAELTLGRFLNWRVQVLPGHNIVDKGPYRLIRHPMYTGQIVSFIGLGLAVQSWAAILVVLVASGIRYGIRIRVEERLLVSKLGNSYVQYMKRTKRLIPFIL
jgi:protein-S-isoprenylcysteine O-methyltransferase Ste14